MLASPLSVSAALALAYAGARGETAEQIAAALQFGSTTAADVHTGLGGWLADLSTPREQYELSIANRAFGQEGFSFHDEYLRTLSEAYQAPLETLDFATAPDAARQAINQWIADHTRDRIQDLLPSGSVTKQTRLTLANAVAFNGAWMHPFYESSTWSAPFSTLPGVAQQVDMMHQVETFRYGAFDGFQMLEMPYVGGDLSMVVMLPDASDGLAALESTMTGVAFESSVAQLSPRQVELSLPRFAFDDGASLQPALEALGMTDAFTGLADFSGIADVDLQISNVIHKATIDVAEGGTEATAATVITLVSTSAYLPIEPPVAFKADHPFLFGIRDVHTGGLLFLGRMASPQGAAFAVPEPAASLSALCGAGLLWLQCKRRRVPPNRTLRPSPSDKGAALGTATE